VPCGEGGSLPLGKDTSIIYGWASNPSQPRCTMTGMSEVTQLLDRIQRGDPHASAQLMPLVYTELRKLAAQKLTQERPGQTLDATALVHEAYLRLVGDHTSGFSQEGGSPGGSLWTIPVGTCSIVGESTPIGIDGGSPMSTIAQRIASAFVVLCGRYGDVTKMAHDRNQSRQALYREASQVAEALDGTTAQSASTSSGSNSPTNGLKSAISSSAWGAPSRSRATSRTSSPASPKPRGSA